MGLFCTFIIHDQSHISTFCTMKKLDIDSKVIYKSLEYLSLKQKEQMYEESFKPLLTTGIKWQNQSRLKAEAPLQSGHITEVPVFAADWWCVGKMVVMVDPRSGLMLTPSRGRDAAWPCHPSCEQRHRTTAATPPSISQPATRSSTFSRAFSPSQSLILAIFSKIGIPLKLPKKSYFGTIEKNHQI